MTRQSNERRNRQVWVLINRRKIPQKEVPARLMAMGFGVITYAAVRQILSRLRKGESFQAG